MDCGSLALVFSDFRFKFLWRKRGRPGRGFDMGQTPAEKGDFPSMRSFIRSSVLPFVCLLVCPILRIRKFSACLPSILLFYRL